MFCLQDEIYIQTKSDFTREFNRLEKSFFGSFQQCRPNLVSQLRSPYHRTEHWRKQTQSAKNFATLWLPFPTPFQKNLLHEADVISALQENRLTYPSHRERGLTTTKCSNFLRKSATTMEVLEAELRTIAKS